MPSLARLLTTASLVLVSGCGAAHATVVSSTAAAASAAPTATAAESSVHLSVGSPVNLGPMTVTLKNVRVAGITLSTGQVTAGTYFVFDETSHLNGAPCLGAADVYLLIGGVRQPGEVVASHTISCTELNDGETGEQAIGMPFVVTNSVFLQALGSSPLTVVLAPGGSTPLASWDYYPQQAAAGPASSSAPAPASAPSTAGAATTRPPRVAHKANAGDFLHEQKDLESASIAEESYAMDHNGHFTADKVNGAHPNPAGPLLSQGLTLTAAESLTAKVFTTASPGDSYCLTIVSTLTKARYYLSSANGLPLSEKPDGC